MAVALQAHAELDGRAPSPPRIVARRAANGTMRDVVENVYTPLAAAVDELRRRRADPALWRRVRAFQAALPPHFLPRAPSLIMVRSIFSPDRECGAFARLAAASGLPPLCAELGGDRFVSFNPGKYGRGRMIFGSGLRRRGLRLIDFHRYDGRPINEIRTRSEQPLLAVHHALLSHAHPELATRRLDCTPWATAASRIAPRYLHLLGLALVDGILAENFAVNDREERRLFEQRVLPSLRRALELFGVRPLIVPVVAPELEDDPGWAEYPAELFPLAARLAARRS